MPTDIFSFKQFDIDQTGCAMRVGTDGVLLGAWAGGDAAGSMPRHCLDIGTGTGLIALMMAQRFPQARVQGIEIDTAAAECARANAAASPFSDRIAIASGDILDSSLESLIGNQRFDLIASNPPFFKSSLHAPDRQRTMARHEETLPLEKLICRASELLSPQGRLALITPHDRLKDLRLYAATYRLVPSRLTEVHTLPHKGPKRLLSEWRPADTAIDRSPLSDTLIIHPATGYYSPEYVRLTEPFYTTSFRILAVG
ncbi:SAM-dependent methlyltransferase [Porphyromonas gulae]|uniref:tRNA1(Val) (adenine(37)-N6)-methyltransferase n=1 Tax=Porphyromonas gulae TaxID=111105 RepID=UPI00052D6A08|nr:methyltransferase [Porphyromonas gulae]KGN74541.1 SAM-dependent methlyltransferase [Porphyromonas gulae]KGO04461.1 SAM-dependent methlyltransferase [Porphyromonas gulae]